MTIALIGESFVESSSAPLVRALDGSAFLDGGGVVALGERGKTLAWWVARPELVREKLRPFRRVLACHFGGNDANPDRALRISQVRTLDALYREEGREVAWLAVPGWPVSTPVTAKRAIQRSAIDSAGVRVIGRGAVLLPGHISGDGTHITAFGARAWVAQLKKRSGTAWPLVAGLIAAGLVLAAGGAS